MGGQIVAGLDYGAVLQMAALLGADPHLTAEVLPMVEPHVLTAWRPES